MNINITENGTSLTVAPEGRLDTTTTPEFESALAARLNGANTLMIDLSKLEYISSAGLRVLLSAHKKMAAKGGMSVCGANETIAEIFEITGFSEILDIK